MSQIPLNVMKQKIKDKENSDELSMINEIEFKKTWITRIKTLNPIPSPAKDLKKEIEQTTITINQESVTHLKQHPINRAIREFNKSVNLIWSSWPIEQEK